MSSPEQPPIISPSLRSSDGSLRAHVEFQFARCPDGCFVVFEDSHGVEVLRVPLTDPSLSRIASAWVGYSIDAWLDDSSGIVLGGSCECDGEGAHPVVIVMADGSVIDSGVAALMGSSGAHVSPDGRHLLSLAWSEVSWGRGVGCAIADSAEVIELLTGETVAAVPFSDLAFVFSDLAFVDWEWLDGRNVAYALRVLPNPEDGTCRQQQFAWRQLPVEWRLLTLP